MADIDDDDQESRDNRPPRPRSLISRGSKAIREEVQHPVTGEWRTVISMSRTKFDEEAKEVFLEEYVEHGRIGEAAMMAGTTGATVREHMKKDSDFGEAVIVAEQGYKDRLIAHHQNLLFNGTMKKTYDRQGNLVSSERVYPIRLIELELKKHDKGYRDKQEVAVNHTGGVLVAPAEVKDIDDWEARFSKAKDITPEPEVIEKSTT